MTDPMQRWRWVGLVVIVLSLIAAAFIGGRLTVTAHTDADEHDHAEEDPTTYYCPMHPQITSTDPADNCPICGMDLVEGEPGDDEDDDIPRLRLSGRAMQLLNIQTWPAERRTVDKQVPLYGKVDYDERRVRSITAWTGGRIDRLLVDFTGQHIERGQPVAELYSPQLISAQQELLEAIRAAEEMKDSGVGIVRQSAQATVISAREKLRLLGLSREQIEQIEKTGEVMEHVTVHAPLSGTVTERRVSEGEYVSTGDPLYVIADLSELWVQMEVYEPDLPWLEVGQPVRFRTEAYPGRLFEGVVGFIDPVLDDRKRTVRVRVEVANPDGRLKPGMFVRGHASFEIRDERQALGTWEPAEEYPERYDIRPPLVIPDSAPLITGHRAVVYVRKMAGERPTFEGREIVLGPRTGDHYIVHEGLEEGDLVVVHGAFRIDSELQIRRRPSMMGITGISPPDVPADRPHIPRPAERAPQRFREQLTALVEAYYPVAEALTEDDDEAARGKLPETIAAYEAIDADLLIGEAREHWEQAAAHLRTALRRMQQAEDLAATRKPLEPLSDWLAAAVRAFGVTGEQPVYYVSCPMAFGEDTTAYWLWPRDEVRNPYQGSRMLQCGDVEGALYQPTPRRDRDDAGHDHGAH